MSDIDIDGVERYLIDLQSRICEAIAAEDGGSPFREDEWSRDGGGGGRSRVLSDGAVFERAGVTPDRPTVVYCGGGIAATLDAFLLHQLGHETLSVYDASMSEWARDESLPMETG